MSGNHPSGRLFPDWYGLRPAWREGLEAAARIEYGSRLRSILTMDRLTYQVLVEVPGHPRGMWVTIEFHRSPPYDCFELPPQEYSRVFAPRGGPSPHRMPGDGALCLYYAAASADERWRPVNGLLSLIDLTANHLFFEDHWRATGGAAGGEWLGPEQPHGLVRGSR